MNECMNNKMYEFDYYNNSYKIILTYNYLGNRFIYLT